MRDRLLALVPGAPPLKPLETVEALVVHHSASPRDTTTRDLIRTWHQAKGWEDIGYHWVIEAGGQIQRGRPTWAQGAHAFGHNDGTLGVCVVGDNTLHDEEWNRNQQYALQELVDAVRLLWGEGLEVCGHRDLPGTATLCPGVDIDL